MTGDADLLEILQTTRTIAVVGASPNPARPSHYVAKFLLSRGFRVIGVNPGLAGGMMFGEPVFARLADIPASIPVDLVEIFRRSEYVESIVEEALAHLPKLRTIWMQLGVQDSVAAATAQAAGVKVVQNRCPKIEIPRLLGAEWRLGAT